MASETFVSTSSEAVDVCKEMNQQSMRKLPWSYPALVAFDIAHGMLTASVLAPYEDSGK